MFLYHFCARTVVQLLDDFGGCHQTINRIVNDKEKWPAMNTWYQQLLEWQKNVVRQGALERLVKEKGVNIGGTFQDWDEMRIHQHQCDNDVLLVVDVIDLLTNTPGLAAPPLTPNGGGGHTTGTVVYTPGVFFWGSAEDGTPD
jgi:hypothetical protein